MDDLELIKSYREVYLPFMNDEEAADRLAKWLASHWKRLSTVISTAGHDPDVVLGPVKAFAREEDDAVIVLMADSAAEELAAVESAVAERTADHTHKRAHTDHHQPPWRTRHGPNRGHPEQGR